MSEEELEYEQYCNEQLRNKITNLEYKIKKLEEENEVLTKARYSIDRVELQERIDKAIKLLELTETRKKICKDFVNVGRKRYDEILNILKGGKDNE